jgi:coenzyme F420-reducing hydrogenase gamma subunit
MAKPKVAFFDFSCCEGCQLMVLNCEPELLDIVGAVDIVNFREAISDRGEDYDIAFIEGSIITPHDVKRIKAIREQAKVVVALGACAHTGGLNKLRNFQDTEDAKKEVYGDDAKYFEVLPKVLAVNEVVKVDLAIPGCPINRFEFISVVKQVLAGAKVSLPNYPVCVECKYHENECLMLKDTICLGPITAAGCDSRCPNNQWPCTGCRGMVANPHLEADQITLSKAGLTVQDILRRYRLFYGYSEVVK